MRTRVGKLASQARGLTDRDVSAQELLVSQDTDSSNAIETCCQSKFLFKPHYLFIYFTLIVKSNNNKKKNQLNLIALDSASLILNQCPHQNEGYSRTPHL